MVAENDIRGYQSISTLKLISDLQIRLIKLVHITNLKNSKLVSGIMKIFYSGLTELKIQFIMLHSEYIFTISENVGVVCIYGDDSRRVIMNSVNVVEFLGEMTKKEVNQGTLCLVQ